MRAQSQKRWQSQPFSDHAAAVRFLNALKRTHPEANMITVRGRHIVWWKE